MKKKLLEHVIEHKKNEKNLPKFPYHDNFCNWCWKTLKMFADKYGKTTKLPNYTPEQLGDLVKRNKIVRIAVFAAEQATA